MIHSVGWLVDTPPNFSRFRTVAHLFRDCGYRAMFVNENKPDCSEWKYGLEQYVRARFKREKESKAGGKY